MEWKLNPAFIHLMDYMALLRPILNVLTLLKTLSYHIYRDDNSVLNFPTGEFVGFYYSEELKYAQSIYRLHSASSQRLSL